MDKNESLSYSRWECKYHVVFISNCRRRTWYQELRKHLSEVFRSLLRQKVSLIIEWYLIAGSCAYVDRDTPEVYRVTGDWLYQRQKCNPFGTTVHGEKERSFVD